MFAESKTDFRNGENTFTTNQKSVWFQRDNINNNAL